MNDVGEDADENAARSLLGDGAHGRSNASSSSSMKDLGDDERAEASNAHVAVTPIEEDGLELAMDDVVALRTRDDAGSASDVERGDGGDGEDEVEGSFAREDAYERWLAPKFWFTVGDVNVFVSTWTLYLWMLIYTLLILISAAVFELTIARFILTSMIWFLLLSVMFTCGYGTMLAHELAHVVMCKRFGGRVDEDKGILLWPFGALAFLHLDGLTLSQELVVTLAGPLSHAPMLVAWYVLSKVTPGIIAEFSRWMAGLNAMFLCWHFLPCYPMDGSRVLACALLLTKKIRVEAAAWLVVIVSYATSIAYIVISLRYDVSITQYFALENLDWILGSMCVVATSHLLWLLRNDRVRDHPTFSRYEVVYDAYHAFEEASRPEVFL